MGLNNDDILSGHVGLTLHWSDPARHRPPHTKHATMPGVVVWLDEMFNRPAKVGFNPFDQLGIYDAYKATKAPPASDATFRELPATPGKVVKHNKVTDPVLKRAVDYYNREKAALQAAGLADNLIDWIMVQDYMESGAYTNTGAKYNNPGAIMWPPHGLKYGHKGPYSTANKTYLAAFKSLPEYVNEKIAVLSQSPGRPVDASSGADFVHRLKLNNYFGKNTSEAQYAAAMRGAAQRLNIIGDLYTDTAQDAAIPPPPGGGFMQFIKDHPLLTGIGATVGVLMVVKVISK